MKLQRTHAKTFKIRIHHCDNRELATYPHLVIGSDLFNELNSFKYLAHGLLHIFCHTITAAKCFSHKGYRTKSLTQCLFYKVCRARSVRESLLHNVLHNFCPAVASNTRLSASTSDALRYRCVRCELFFSDISYLLFFHL